MRLDVLLGVSGPGWWTCQVLAGGSVRSWLLGVSGPSWHIQYSFGRYCPLSLILNTLLQLAYYC